MTSDAVVLVNAQVVTGDPRSPRARSLRIEGGRITAVDADEPARFSGRRLDLDGAVVLPGLVDSHLHLQSLGAQAREIDLSGCTSEAQAAELVRRAVLNVPKGRWIRGRGWDQTRWPASRYPSRASLDAVAPDWPVLLVRIDSHAAWVNGLALARAGIEAHTPDPLGGRIGRTASGDPDGLLVDSAMGAVLAAVPHPSEAELERDLVAGLERCARVGLTGVHEMGTTPAMLRVLEQLAAEERLPVRVSSYLLGTPDELAPLFEQPRRRVGLLHVCGLKLLLDGALGSHGAALLEPYADRPETRGLLLHERAELSAWVHRVVPRGYQLALHAIGDAANRLALDVITEVRQLAPGRHRIEHAQIVHRDDVARFAALGAVASVQPLHATDDMHFAEARLGRERLSDTYAWRRFAAAGVVLACGSDAPIAEENPWRGIHAAVARQRPTGEPPGGFLVSEALSIEQALMGYTMGAARAIGELDLGRIAVGMRADLSIVDKDPFAIPASELARVRPLGTIVAGGRLQGELA